MKKTLSTPSLLLFVGLLDGCNPSQDIPEVTVIQRRSGSVEITQEHDLNKHLDRNLIRRIQESIYVDGLNTVVLDNGGQHMASLTDINARYRVALLMASAEFSRK